MNEIQRPKHYELKGLEPYESIDVVKAILGNKGFEAFCKGNILKYLIREENKAKVEDLKKASIYLNWLINARSVNDNI